MMLAKKTYALSDLLFVYDFSVDIPFSIWGNIFELLYIIVSHISQTPFSFVDFSPVVIAYYMPSAHLEYVSS